MSTDMVDIIRAIVRDELASLRLGDVAVVTSVFPHSDEGDEANYECSVQLRGSDLELRQVPLCTPHIGMASTPQVGDLVLVMYVGGDANRPIIVGRLYSDEMRPPVHDEGEWRLESPLGGACSLAIDKDENVVVKAGENLVQIATDGTISVTGKEDLSITVDGNVHISCTDCTVDASDNIALGSDGTPVITEGSHKCYYSGAPLVGSGTVTAKG